MTRIVLPGLAIIALAAAASTGIVLWTTRERPVAKGSPDERSPEAPASNPASSTSPDPAASAAAGRRPGEAGTAAPPPTRRSVPGRIPETAVPREKHQAAISFRQQMIAGIASLKGAVAPCGLADRPLMLSLESVEGGVRVVDVRPDRRAPADESAEACARSLLVGRLISAPSVEAGRRWQMPLAVGPTR